MITSPGCRRVASFHRSRRISRGSGQDPSLLSRDFFCRLQATSEARLYVYTLRYAGISCQCRGMMPWRISFVASASFARPNALLWWKGSEWRNLLVRVERECLVRLFSGNPRHLWLARGLWGSIHASGVVDRKPTDEAPPKRGENTCSRTGEPVANHYHLGLNG